MSEPMPPRGPDEPVNPPWPVLLRRAAAWALAVGLAAGVLYGLVGLARAALGGPGVDVVALTRRCGGAALFVFLAALPLRLLYLSRPALDRTFAALGFLATFFGLAMLCVFFARLGLDAEEWFRVMPVLVEENNRALLRRPDDYLRTVQARLTRELAQDRERAARLPPDALLMSELPPEKRRAWEEEYRKLTAALGTAADEGEKKELVAKYQEARRNEVDAEFEKSLRPFREAQWAKTYAELKDAVARALRPDPNAAELVAHFASSFPDSAPQDAGIYPALLGSIWLGLITLLLAVPIGVGAALYLEEYRGRGWLGHVIQVNINNLAGVPSVVYGILGAFVFVGLIFRPLERLHPEVAARNLLGGAMTLALLTLPIVIVAAQEAIRAVPTSIRHGAYALGSTKWQVIWHQVLPMARPGILTGTILSLSRAIGEAAPLVLFGALTFVTQEPNLLGRFTAMPLQIFNWADRPAVVTATGASVEAWRYNAAVASIFLLLALLLLNGVAIVLRNRAQKRMRY